VSTVTRKRSQRGRSRATIDLIATCSKIIEPCQPITVRGVCYKLFVAGLIDSMAVKNTQKVSRILKDAREQGLIPWKWIVDESRHLEWIPAWSDLEEYGEKIARDYRRDFWADQPYHIIITSEKGTVAGVLNPLLNQYGVSFFAAHGFNSATKIHDLADRIRSDDRQWVFLYVGDHDPSGMSMSEVDFVDRLHRYGGHNFTFDRIALAESDTVYLPSFPAKTTDPRYRWYRKQYGIKAWELDAMDPGELRSRVASHIEKYIDRGAWDRHKYIEEAQRRSTKMVADQLAAMNGGAA
jgi:hypothetical protein